MVISLLSYSKSSGDTYDNKGSCPCYDQSTCTIQDVAMLLFGYKAIVEDKNGNFDKATKRN